MLSRLKLGLVLSTSALALMLSVKPMTPARRLPEPVTDAARACPSCREAAMRWSRNSITLPRLSRGLSTPECSARMRSPHRAAKARAGA